MNQDLYTEILLDEYKNLQNKGKMPNADLVLEGSNSSCGDSIKIYLKLESNKITDISWEGEGCVISQVAMSLLSAKIKQAPLDTSLPAGRQGFKKQDMLELLGLEQISPGREKCLMLGLETLRNVNPSTMLGTSL